MNTEKIPVNQQISELIRSSKCIFKVHSKTLNVIKIDTNSIYSNYMTGDFGKWNAQYSGNANLVISDDKGDYSSYLYDIKGYAKIEGDTVIDIDKTISASRR